MIVNRLQRTEAAYGNDEADARLIRTEQQPTIQFGSPDGHYDLRALLWIYRQVETPRRIVRATLAVLSFTMRRYSKVRSFLSALFGPRLDDADTEIRAVICADCDRLTYHGSWLRDLLKLSGAYCGACDCWTWWFAELKRKLRMARAHCPLGKHPEIYPYWMRFSLFRTCRGCSEQSSRQENNHAG